MQPKGATGFVRYRFDDCVLDTDRRELHRGAALVALEPQVFDLIEFLIRNRERVVSKHDVFAAVWGGRIVSDSALTTRLNAARAAIGDDGRAQRLIKTLLRKGLRFVGAVQEQDDRRRQRPFEISAVPIEPLPAATRFATSLRSAPARHALPDAPSIAVLPFLSHEIGDDFGDGIVEGMLLSLTGLHELFVISRGSTIAFRGSERDPRSIGEMLGVRYIIAGSVRQSGERVRIWAELCDVASGETLWTDRLEAALGEVFALQDQIVAELVARIAPSVRQAELERALRKAPESLSAYDCTIRALNLFYMLERGGFDQAGGLLRKARQIEPTFALPFAWGAWIHMYRVAYGWSSDGRAEIGEATRLAQAALQLDGRNARALATCGHLASLFHRDYDTAQHYLDRALAACPNDPFGWALSSATMSYTGDAVQAIPRARHALRLSPCDKYRFYYLACLALAHYSGGDYEGAVSWGRISLRESPGFTPTLRYLAAALAACGDLAGAREAARMLLARQPNFTLRDYQATNQPFRDPAQKVSHLAHLRLAGLPAA
jgi:TolB-like protein